MTISSRWVFCAFSCLFVAINSGCLKRESAPTPAEKILRLSQRNEPATLDPQRATLPDEFFIIRALGEGLLVPNPDGGAPLPGAAERYEVSPDGLTYTFHLRSNAKWSNGGLVTAGDFVGMIHGATAPGSLTSKIHLFTIVRDASAPSSQTLVVVLKQPVADFPAIVASGPWIALHPSSSLKHPIGNGPFVLSEWKPNQHITVRRNPHYHSLGDVKLDRIDFLAFDSGETEERAFRTGQVDVTMWIPFPKLTAYLPPIRQIQPLFETRYFVLNTTRHPLDDPRVRRALALAIDRQALVERVTRGGQRPALSLVPQGLGGYEPSAIIDGDQEEARTLLAAAGFAGGAGFPRLTIATWVNNPVLEAIQQMWKRELGIDVALIQSEGKIHLAALGTGDFDIAFLPAIPDYASPAALLQEWHSAASTNYARWHDARYDQLVNEAGRTGNAARRLDLFQQAEARILTQMPVIPLYFNTQNFLVAPRVKNWRADRLWTRFYRDVTIDR